jgi:putative peptidoglycan lipid II flippase
VVFFVVPSSAAFAALGIPIVGLLFQTGQFGADDTRVVAGVLAAYSVGLPAQASVKLLASGFYAMGDTRTPVKAAAVSMVLSAALAALFMLRLGPAGIALGASLAAYVNVLLNFRGLRARLGPLLVRRTWLNFAVVLSGSMVAASAGMGVARLVLSRPVVIVALAALISFGLVYVLYTALLGHVDARALLRRFARTD